MPPLRTLGDFARQCDNSGQMLKAARVAYVNTATKELTRNIRINLKHDAPNGLVKRKSKRPARVGVAYNIRSGSEPSGYIYARGPFQLIERDTSAHAIPKTLSKTNTKRRKRQLRAGFRARKTLKIPGIGYRRRVNHPGTTGKRPFGRAVDQYEATGRTQRVYKREMARALEGHFQ